MIDQRRIEAIHHRWFVGEDMPTTGQMQEDVEHLLSTIAFLRGELVKVHTLKQASYTQLEQKLTKAQREVGRLKAAPLRQQADRLMQEVNSLNEKMTELNALQDATYNLNIKLQEERDLARAAVERLGDRIDEERERHEKEVVEVLRRRDEANGEGE